MTKNSLVFKCLRNMSIDGEFNMQKNSTANNKFVLCIHVLDLTMVRFYTINGLVSILMNIHRWLNRIILHTEWRTSPANALRCWPAFIRLLSYKLVALGWLAFTGLPKGVGAISRLIE